MRKVLTIILLFIVVFSYGQTKEETQEWIKSKLEYYCLEGFHYGITFENCFMTIINKEKRIDEDDFKGYGKRLREFEVVIPIKELEGCLSNRKREKDGTIAYYSMIFITKDKKKKISSHHKDSQITTYENYYELKLSPKINFHEYVSRLDKAILHLIDLCDGKEPF